MRKFVALFIVVFSIGFAQVSTESITFGPWQPEFSALEAGEYFVAAPAANVQGEECRVYVASKGYGDLEDIETWADMQKFEVELRVQLTPDFNSTALEPIAVRVMDWGEDEMGEIAVIYVARIGVDGAQGVIRGGITDGTEYLYLEPVEGLTFNCRTR